MAPPGSCNLSPSPIKSAKVRVCMAVHPEGSPSPVRAMRILPQNPPRVGT